MQLLEKTRRVTKLLQQDAGYPVDFQGISRVLSDLIAANVYLLDSEGKILGYALTENYRCSIMEDDILQRKVFPADSNFGLLQISGTRANLDHSGRCVFDPEEACVFPRQRITLVPIYGSAQRLGTLALAKFDGEFSEDDLVLAEYSSTVVGLEILRSRQGEMELEARRKAAVQVAVGTLSHSEREAVVHIFEELEGDEGMLVASKVADRVGITRSVIVNALRKFQSAGVVEARSLGMKGTYIRVLNPRLSEELAKLR